MENSSGNSSYQLNAASVEEMVMSTSGISADTNADGVVVNIIPKEGGNTFKTTIAALFANNSLESDNLDDALQAARPDDVDQDAEAVRRVRQRRRTDQEGQALVLRHAAQLGVRAAVRRRLLEQDAGCSS